MESKMKKNFLEENKNQKGFAMLFTVLIVSLILSIALSISNTTFKQTILSNLAKDSQISFYQADSTIECALYNDLTLDIFKSGTDPSSIGKITCGANNFLIVDSESYKDHFVFQEEVENPFIMPCSKLLVDKDTQPGQTIIKSRGYNICENSPKKVERALEVIY